MAALYYGYDFPPPIADHLHERRHQHSNFLQYLTRQHPRPEDHPNNPDIDIRDAIDAYLVEIEMPGIKDTKRVTVSWTGTRSLTVTGNVTRPEYELPIMNDNETGSRDAKGEYKEPPIHHAPMLLVSERRVGPFRRQFVFPDEVDKEHLTAKLEAGLLRLKVPKQGHKDVPKVANIEIEPW